MRKSSMPACWRATAMPSPPNPAPTTTTRYVESSGTGPPRAQRGPGPGCCPGTGAVRTRHGQDSRNHPDRPGPPRGPGTMPGPRTLHRRRLAPRLIHPMLAAAFTGWLNRSMPPWPEGAPRGRHGLEGHDVSESLSYRGVGAADRTRTLFGQTMGYVAATTGFFALGAYLGRNLSEGWAIVWFIVGFACLIAM